MALSDQAKDSEKSYWDQYHTERDVLPPIDPEDIRRTLLQPSYSTGIDTYCDNRAAFYDMILRDGGWQGKRVLDYACGDGKWAGYYVLTGASSTVGFDLSEIAIRRGRERIAAQGLEDRVDLQVMDATKLQFPDDSFGLVIGNAVLHHTIKYPGIFEELHRVMRRGGAAYFMENLADFPLWRLWWAARGEVPDGDVPIFAREVRRKARMFRDVRIVGDTFLYSVRRVIWRPSPGPVVRLVLRTCKRLDSALFRVCPRLRAWGSFSYIKLTK